MKTRRLGGWCFFLVLALMVGAACKKGGDSADPAWIRVNGQEIKKSEIEKEINRYRMELEQRFGDQIPAEERAKLENLMKREAMLNAVRRVVLDQAADKEGISADQAQVEDQIKKIKEQFPDEAAFQNKLKELNLTEQNLRDDVTRKFRYEELFKRKVVIPEPSEEEISATYEQAKPRLLEPAKVKGVHILITIPPAAPEEEKKKKKEQAETALKRIQAGEDIGKVAAELSEAQSKTAGGKETLSKGQVPELDKVIFDMKPGNITSILESPMGYHIVKVEEVIPERTTPLEEVRANIIDVLKENKRNEFIQKFIEDLIKNASVEYLEPLPAESRQEPPPPLAPEPETGATAMSPEPAAGATPFPKPAEGSTAQPTPAPSANEPAPEPTKHPETTEGKTPPAPAPETGATTKPEPAAPSGK